MEYPVLLRKDSLRCKLLDEDILYLRKLKKIGYSNQKIANIMRLSTFTVWYWTTTGKNRELYSKKKYQKNKPFIDKAYHRQKVYESIKRKKKIQGKEFKKWFNERFVFPFLKKPEYIKKKKEYWNKNKKRLNEQRRKKYWKNKKKII